MGNKYKHTGRVDVFEKQKPDNTGAWVIGIIVFVGFLIAIA